MRTDVSFLNFVKFSTRLVICPSSITSMGPFAVACGMARMIWPPISNLAAGVGTPIPRFPEETEIGEVLVSSSMTESTMRFHDADESHEPVLALSETEIHDVRAAKPIERLPATITNAMAEIADLMATRSSSDGIWDVREKNLVKLNDFLTFCQRKRAAVKKTPPVSGRGFLKVLFSTFPCLRP